MHAHIITLLLSIDAPMGSVNTATASMAAAVQPDHSQVVTVY